MISIRIRRTLLGIISIFVLLFLTQCIGRSDMYVNRQDYETGPLEIFGIISAILFTLYISYHIIGFLFLALKKPSEDQKASLKRHAEKGKQLKQENKKRREIEKERKRKEEYELVKEIEKQVLERQIEEYESIPRDKRSKTDQTSLDYLKEKHWRAYEAENSWDIYPDSIMGRYLEESKKLAEEFKKKQIEKEESLHFSFKDIQWIGNRDFWNNNKNFFLHLLSTHYPFNEEQLKRYNKILPFGTEYSTSDERSSFEITGLIFNKNIVWTNILQEIYYQPPELIYVGESTDVGSRETDFSRYPITYNDNLEKYKNFEISRALKCCSDVEEMGRCDEYIEEEYESLKAIVDKSYKFDDDELKKIITNSNLLIASYEHFYRQVMELVERSNGNFRIVNFLEEILKEHDRDTQ